ncbi:hypothetical protein B0H14DRAFT_3510576 [Mycena olivaceomarginata]|nr:hypothetical protein B0H14DRAFT_3510576 [Mycena olivaceomarginata]
MNAKGRVGEWLSVQPSGLGEELTWSRSPPGRTWKRSRPGLFGPLNVREDGTVVFAAPLEDGHVPLIALKDLGWWARYTPVTGTTSSRPSRRSTGLPAVYKRLSIEEYFSVFEAEKLDGPLASDKRRGDGSKSVGDNFRRFCACGGTILWTRIWNGYGACIRGRIRWSGGCGRRGMMGKAGSVLKNTLEGKMEFGYRKEVASLL